MNPTGPPTAPPSKAKPVPPITAFRAFLSPISFGEKGALVCPCSCRMARLCESCFDRLHEMHVAWRLFP
jgi:hypothetical protein